MNRIKELHQLAMDFAEKAFKANLEKDPDKAETLLRDAFKNESEAAKLLANDLTAEPTRSILYRSAASIGLDCGEFREAERLIAIALAGNPPEEISEELRDLLEQVYFRRHLDLRGLILESDEFQMSIAGRGVGLGITFHDAFIDRVVTTAKLFSRTVERKLGKTFREAGRIPKVLSEEFRLYLSTPRPASFAITFKIGRQKTLAFPDLIYPADVVDEFLTCIDLLQNSKEKALKERIIDEAYYNNFIGLTRQLAPDGEEVNIVGFTSMHKDQKREIALTRISDQIPLIGKLKEVKKEIERVSVTGQLLYADSRKKSEIQLIDEKGSQHRVIVPMGMMSDIVKPLWEDTVIVTGTRTDNAIRLEDIRKVREESDKPTSETIIPPLPQD